MSEQGLGATQRYEIKAHAFARMTGYMAPGKDEPPQFNTPYAERVAAWDKWHKEHGIVIEAMLNGMEEAML